jgi:dihydropteroate synthase
MSANSPLEPIGLISGTLADVAVAQGHARRLADGLLAFAGLLSHGRDRTERILAIEDAPPDAVSRLSDPRPAFAGLSLDRPHLMGIVNVTPDSFSDGGDAYRAEAAIARGLSLAEEGADIIDVGGESTRPGAAPVAPQEEIGRILPVVRALARQGLKVSIDTRHAVVMRAALDAGAAIINDVTGLSGDPDSLAIAAASKAPVVLMHMRGQPRTMQEEARYAHLLLDVHDELAARVAACLDAGILAENICIDPGIGFAKTQAQNAPLIAHLALLHSMGLPILAGVSRKGFIGLLSGVTDPKARMPGSIAAGLACLDKGVQILRVHDVAATAQAVAVWRGLAEA